MSQPKVRSTTQRRGMRAAAAIRVCDAAGLQAAAAVGHLQGVDDERGTVVIGHRVSDDLGCAPSDRTLTQEEALAALRQPRTAACIECDAARSLTPKQHQTDQDPQIQRGEEARQATDRSETPT
ncbi:hypothetical protein [Streptomyces sp. NPDC007205]|uniref:hypothetical protein n=1 Tax=Streptomyces sp. NPDC007205 TaxID=3154316 RepID=UPI0033F47C77